MKRSRHRARPLTLHRARIPQSDRYLRAGNGREPHQRRSQARRCAIVRSEWLEWGELAADRAATEAFGVPIVYHSRNQQPGVNYKYYPKLLDMARDVDTLMATCRGAGTKNMINAEVLKALGPPVS